jgi:hypothetical protein
VRCLVHAVILDSVYVAKTCTLLSICNTRCFPRLTHLRLPHTSTLIPLPLSRVIILLRLIVTLGCPTFKTPSNPIMSLRTPNKFPWLPVFPCQIRQELHSTGQHLRTRRQCQEIPNASKLRQLIQYPPNVETPTCYPPLSRPILRLLCLWRLLSQIKIAVRWCLALDHNSLFLHLDPLAHSAPFQKYQAVQVMQTLPMFIISFED